MPLLSGINFLKLPLCNLGVQVQGTGSAERWFGLEVIPLSLLEWNWMDAQKHQLPLTGGPWRGYLFWIQRTQHLHPPSALQHLLTKHDSVPGALLGTEMQTGKSWFSLESSQSSSGNRHTTRGCYESVWCFAKGVHRISKQIQNKRTQNRAE